MVTAPCKQPVSMAISGPTTASSTDTAAAVVSGYQAGGVGDVCQSARASTARVDAASSIRVKRRQHAAVIVGPRPTGIVAPRSGTDAARIA